MTKIKKVAIIIIILTLLTYILSTILIKSTSFAAQTVSTDINRN